LSQFIIASHVIDRRRSLREADLTAWREAYNRRIG
jgi:hypothetical protein